MKYSGSISDRIKALRAEMRREKIDLYIIPSTDYHNSEYIGEYFKERQYMTGFTGSAGTVVFTEEKAGLWTRCLPTAMPGDIWARVCRFLFHLQRTSVDRICLDTYQTACR